MRFFTLIKTSAILAATTLSAPLDSYPVVHEKRHALPDGWTKRQELDRRVFLPMKIALKQSNLDKAWEWLEEVSSPGSEKYGMHWSAKDVAEAFAPSEESVSAVRDWLASAGISDTRISQSQSLGFLEFNSTVDEAQELLQTKYHVYKHEATGRAHVACEEYSVPSHLREHVDFVYPTLQFDAKLKHKRAERPHLPSSPKPERRALEQSQAKNQLDECDERITPDCLRALYRFPPNEERFLNSENSFGIVEYTPWVYLPGDMDMFFQRYSPQAVGKRPILDSIDGGKLQLPKSESGFWSEPDLDLQYGMTLVYPQQVTLYQVGDGLEDNFEVNNFLDALDASYCTYDGGDDPKYDGVYPDPLRGGYKGPLNCGSFAATKVISSSYTDNESDDPPTYFERQCHEYLKLGLMGVSVLACSGDFGVAGNGGDSCINGTGFPASYLKPKKGGHFVPTFPGTCPYVTSVGGTQVKHGVNVPQALAAGEEPEEALQAVSNEVWIRSAGGFSDVFALPSYQEQAVHEFLAKYPPPYGAMQYNNSGQVRGYPDVSANGAHFVYVMDGKFDKIDGTSASAPTFASILTMINEARLNKGMSSVGFINPVAYKYPEMFNDITEGSNPGCATKGFSAEPGWDPVTGLGTPNFPKMLEVFVEQAANWGPPE